MAVPDVAALVEELYALGPSEFVAGRKRLAADLKSAGEKDAAASFLKLRKPTVLEHALNQTARSDPDAVGAWAAAVEVVGDAQSAAIGGGDAGPLREATAQLRAATARLVKAGSRHAGAAKSGEVATFLAGLATPSGTSLLRRGVLGSAAPDADDDLFAGAPEPPARPATEPAGSRVANRTKPAADQPAPTRGPSKQALQRHAAALEKAARARDTAEREVERLSAELARAQDRLDAAERDLADLERSAPT